MDVFRVASLTRFDRFGIPIGPYDSSGHGYRDEHTPVKNEYLTFALMAGGPQPTPYGDGIYFPRREWYDFPREYYCGFESIEQFIAWFTDSKWGMQLEAFNSGDFALYRYVVHPRFIKFGRHQVMARLKGRKPAEIILLGTRTYTVAELCALRDEYYERI